MTEHTPLPWHLGSTGHTELVMGFKGDREVILAELGVEADTSFDDDRANAAYIVKACNAYPGMVMLLAKLRAIIEDEIHDYGPSDKLNRDLVEEITCLIAPVKSPGAPS